VCLRTCLHRMALSGGGMWAAAETIRAGGGEDLVDWGVDVVCDEEEERLWSHRSHVRQHLSASRERCLRVVCYLPRNRAPSFMLHPRVLHFAAWLLCSCLLYSSSWFITRACPYLTIWLSLLTKRIHDLESSAIRSKVVAVDGACASAQSKVRIRDET
jgi:hypothetical protein